MIDLEEKKNQYFGFIVIILLIGFLNYFRKVSNGLRLSRTGKILYLITMVIFVIGIMFVLYFTKLNNIISFCIGLSIMALSENIAKLFLVMSDKFNPILVKFVKFWIRIDLSEEFDVEKEAPVINININTNNNIDTNSTTTVK